MNEGNVFSTIHEWKSLNFSPIFNTTNQTLKKSELNSGKARKRKPQNQIFFCLQFNSIFSQLLLHNYCSIW
jgi:hypothetical protein